MSGADDLQRISRAIGDLMRVAGSDRVHAVRQEATGVDLTRTEMRFLAVVDDEGPLPVTELGAVLHLSQPTASRTLRRLEEEGLVRRRSDVSDARVARYETTDECRQVRRRFQAFMDQQLEESLSGMSAVRRRQLADLLDELVGGAHRSERQPTTGAADRTASSAANTSGSRGREK